MTLMRN